MPTLPISPDRRTLLALAALTAALFAPASPGDRPGAASAQDKPAVSTSPAPAQPSAAAAPSATAGGVDFAKDRDAIFDAFYKTDLDTSAAFTVSNLAIRKDNMTLLLKRGTLFLMKPIAGEVTGAAFIGDGEASMVPPTRTQRYMLKKYSGAETLNEPFSEAVLRFADGTDKTLRAAAKPDSAGSVQAEAAQKIFKDRNNWSNSDRGLGLEMEFIEDRISGLEGRDPFAADLHTVKHDWLTYIYDPQSVHENYLGATQMLGAGRRYDIPWSIWHKQADYAQGGYYRLTPDRDGPRLLRVQHNEMTLNLPGTKTVEWDARLTIQPLADNLRCLRFDLDNNGDSNSRWFDDLRPVRVVSLTDEAGAPLPYMHKKDELLVVLAQPTKVGTPFVLRVKGTADVIYQVTAESYGLIQATWYPATGYHGGRSSFHWTVRVPKTFLVTGSGKTLREFEDKEAGLNGIEMSCDESVDFPWVIFGRFQKSATTYVGEESKKSVPLTIHSFPYMTITITDHDILDEFNLDHPFTFELKAPPKKIDGIFGEFKEILKLYEKIYGPYPYDELHVAQMGPFLGFGQSPQGFVQLTGEAFMSQAEIESDFFHGFVAHEFAHQWWGHQISDAAPEDEWLSESFAEYAAGIFVNEYQGPKRFQRTLTEWRKRAKMSDQEGPIAAANQLSGPNGGRNRTSLLYDKGPYVLHMLRVQLDDEKYMKVMRGLQEHFRNQNITTEMLVREVNTVTGADYTSFFDQWFWDVGIPTFRYTWRTEKQPDGKFLIIVHVRQDDKVNFKKVLMPVQIHFKDKTIPQYKPIVQAEQDIKLMSPVEPKDVTLDDDRTLLAEIVKGS